MSGLRFDPEHFKVVEPRLKAGKPPLLKTALEIREFTNQLLTQVLSAIPYPSNVKETVFTIQSYDGVDIQVTRFASDKVLESADPTPAIVYTHGGGLVACNVGIFAPQIARQAQEADIPYFAVEYRLAPENLGPCAAEDCFAALKYISEHASDFNVDPTKIALLGDSAGGGVAAGAALIARDRQLSPPVAKQILIYPMLDDRTELHPDDPMLAFLTWQSNDNVIAWNAYVGEAKRGKSDADISPYAAPARAISLRGLPPTYIDVGTLDLFRDEDIAFAARLAKDEVEVEFHLWPGLPHGFDGMSTTTWTKRAQESRLNALRRIGV
ncbi:Alpha/Beta hydrolase protein [Dactylonectria estremocensis]|uniref:Alpha/Beta hydrolase protein n=1 Tax=Dactylonectria estremocensis TaxID=1079267 RepID=A0A9P9E8K3_9HYPO|nr:Alpha/Beta hydrolase protein [Dactylonectria estremocensis]